MEPLPALKAYGIKQTIGDLWIHKSNPNIICSGYDLDPEDADIIPFFKGLKYDEVDLTEGLISENSPFEDFTNESLNYYIATYFLLACDIIISRKISWETSIYWCLEFFKKSKITELNIQNILLFYDLLQLIIKDRELFKMLDDEPILIVLEKCEIIKKADSRS